MMHLGIVGGGKLLRLYNNNVSFRLTVWMRLCCYFKSHLYLFPLFAYAKLRYSHLTYKTGIQIPYSTSIGKGFYIGHFGTIVINGNAIIGENVNISPGVNIGQASRGKHKGTPIVGNRVYIGPGAKIIGNITIGNNVCIGANAVVTNDIPDNACVAGIPATLISMKGAEGYIVNPV